MSSCPGTPWGKIAPIESMNFAAIVRNQKQEKQMKLANERERREFTKEQSLEDVFIKTVEEIKKEQELDKLHNNISREDFLANLPLEVLAFLKSEEEQLAEVEASALTDCESDAVIAQMLQAQFDREYNENLKRIERAQNKQSKITLSLEKYRKPHLRDVGEEVEDDFVQKDEFSLEKRDWDRFESNERLLDAIPKCGYTLDEEGEMITKHDADLCGVRNACRMMSFPLEMATGDGAGFDMKLSNSVFNQLKTHARKGHKKNRMQDRKDNAATAEKGVDGRTRLLLYKLINNQILEQIDGIISTGKEAVILHAYPNPLFAGSDPKLTKIMPKECAVKIFKTTLNDFKQRDRYIKDDYRFKDRFNIRFSKQNNFIIINMWAEKEMFNLIRIKNVGINCPEVVILKKHVLVMSFVGDQNRAAPKLKDALLSHSEWCSAYDEVVEAMHKLFNEAKLVHGDLSEYNILWHDSKCWFIDVAQSVEPHHPNALEFLMRDCNNITTFFSKKRVPRMYSKEQLFEYITSLNAENLNVALLERMHTKGADVRLATAPNRDECPLELKPLEYPFDLVWENVAQSKSNVPIIDQAAKVLNVVQPVDCRIQSSLNELFSDPSTAATAVNSVSNTANI
uniref:Serine/threonine-protein kinase RIO3 n=1 Tax=Glossina brevipalpis TaxID=37001 RepID=A0A1A9WUJ8_9MUSC